jgi:hypothetical protein
LKTKTFNTGPAEQSHNQNQNLTTETRRHGVARRKISKREEAKAGLTAKDAKGAEEKSGPILERRKNDENLREKQEFRD